MQRDDSEPGLTHHGEQAEALQQLGFTGYEAKVYLSLLREFPATAYEISKRAGLPRANVYNALATLEKKLAVQPVNENPVRYVPVEPRQLLDRIQRETANRCDSLAEQLIATKAVEATEFVWTLSGNAHIHAKMDDLIEQAKVHVWIKAAHHLLRPHIEPLRQAARRGARILIILFGSPADLVEYDFGGQVKVYLHESSGAAVGLSDWLVTMTRDFEEAMTATTGPKGYGVFTRSRPVVNMAESLIRHEIYVAEIFAHFGKQLESRFGPALYSLRHQYLPAEQVRQLDALVGMATGAKPAEPAGKPVARRTAAPRKRTQSR
ncbi:MAG: TrmB family transcriptional regulator [Burkholderiales bacterium]|nr:TrmB family transcriptional regulator [Burkholderiales bacterium]